MIRTATELVVLLLISVLISIVTGETQIEAKTTYAGLLATYALVKINTRT